MFSNVFNFFGFKIRQSFCNIIFIMNWGLKRNQLHSRPSPSGGMCTIAEEADIDYAFLRLQKLEETNRTVQKECKNLRDSFSALARSEQKLTAGLSSCNQVYEEETFRALVEEYHSVAKQMSDSSKQFSDVVQITVNDPLKKLATEFGSAQGAIKKRDQMITDLLPVRRQLEKMKDKERTGTNIARTEQLKRSLAVMEGEFKGTNKQLLNDMNTMLELRADYIEPSLLALIRAETNYYGECTKLFNSLVLHSDTSPYRTSPRVTKSEPAASELEARFNQDMQAIRALSIVADK